MSRNAPPPVALFYGNQPFSVNRAARKLADQVLGEGPRDFSYQRFDAAEMIRPAPVEATEEMAAAFQIACESAPFLCEQWVVRLDSLEAVKPSERAARSVLSALGGLKLFRCPFEGEDAWALEEDLLVTDPRESGTAAQRWVQDVQSGGDGSPVVHLAPDAHEQRFVLSRRGARRLVDAKEFLRAKLPGRISFADESESDRQAAASASVTARLHRLLEHLLERPPAGLCLILTAGATRERELSRFLVAGIKRRGVIEAFVTYDDYQPIDLVLREARERGIRLNRVHAELVIQKVGSDLGRLTGELDKLALTFREGEPPDEDTFLRALGGGGVASLFLVTEKLGANDLAGALAAVEQFLAESPHEHPVLIGILARYVRQLLHIHALSRLGVADADWPSHLKLHPFIAGRLAAQARRFSEAELERMMRALAALDVAAKRHAHLTKPLFREFIHAVCRQGFRRVEPDFAGIAADPP